MSRFRAVKNFHCDVTGSDYVTGLKYTIRPGNDALAERVEGWVKDGLAEMVTSETESSAVTGAGMVAFLALCLFPTYAWAQQVPGSVPSDCSADATAGLNAFFVNVQNGATVTFPAGGCYLTVGTVELRGKTDVTVQGNGAELVRNAISPQSLRYPNRNPYFRVLNSTRVVVDGLAIRGTNDGSDLGGTVADANGVSRSVDCLANLPDWGCYTQTLEFEHAIEILGSIDAVAQNITISDIWGDGFYVVGNDQFTTSRVGA